jgi:hypothetical protein
MERRSGCDAVQCLFRPKGRVLARRDEPASVLAVGIRPRDSIGTAGTFAVRTNNG